ncbi:SNF2 family N-terminal domain-containing protein [Microdochium trichocladiopsis]|uniref:SNF2 family N-terminal domain-containing protein n=1 Tax=Microdochium trichocladiopsis TaxID=1682393 RepID=A0A9P9BJ81_9PEZI|nr:SNF2 family N-terminal domain-containing protein [Microdochium trichocladiopsis]KAH7016463.1 SNF2 family N-terminal domain-containing protein [Microdochium trichocladiopsis]
MSKCSVLRPPCLYRLYNSEPTLDLDSRNYAVAGYCLAAMTDGHGIGAQPCNDLNEREHSSSLICFGMLYLNISMLGAEKSSDLEDTDVRLGADGHVSSISDPNRMIGRIDKRHHSLLNLLEREGLQLQMSLGQQPGSSPKYGTSSDLALRAILYGLRTHIPPLVDVLSAQELYLQLPIQPRLDALYHNPQSLFNEPYLKTTHGIFHPQHDCPDVTTSIIEPKNILDGFTTGSSLEETECTNLITTSLKLHQKQALSFMLAREGGWRFEPHAEDVWSIATTRDNQFCGYVNNVDGSTQNLPPAPCHGGIIADTMGYGKTLTMISLIAHELSEVANTSQGYSVSPYTTMIVVPANLLGYWHKELTKHTKPGSVRWHLENGSKRLKKAAGLRSIDVLLVSYPTLARDWTTCKSTSILFQTRWHRVILDEAHSIKNPQAVTARAACDIMARNRWAVTGTPITNRLLDLFPLLKFIGASPYNKKDVFLSRISDLVRQGQGHEQLAVTRVKRLLSAMMLRRSKELPLPDKTELLVSVRLNEREAQLYNEAKDRALSTIDSALSLIASSNSYRNILQKIDVLRQICAFGRSNTPISVTPTARSPLRENDWDQYAATKAFSQMLDLGLHTVCAECSTPILTLADENAGQAVLYLTQCLRAWCKSCYEVELDGETSCGPRICACPTPCVVAPAAVSEPAASLSFEVTGESIGYHDTPSKIRALVDDLQKQMPGTKSVVFSFWKATLDIARTSFDRSGIHCLQIDGSVKSKERAKILETFSAPNEIQVLLLSLSCGALGLTLTAASRAYLMEPQWNPAIEDQAFARVHRITQVQETTMIRYVMEDTIEQYVRKVQDGKRDLVTAFLSPRGDSRDVSLEKLRELRNYI